MCVSEAVLVPLIVMAVIRMRTTMIMVQLNNKMKDEAVNKEIACGGGDDDADHDDHDDDDDDDDVDDDDDDADDADDDAD